MKVKKIFLSMIGIVLVYLLTFTFIMHDLSHKIKTETQILTSQEGPINTSISYYGLDLYYFKAKTHNQIKSDLVVSRSSIYYFVPFIATAMVGTSTLLLVIAVTKVFNRKKETTSA